MAGKGLKTFEEVARELSEKYSILCFYLEVEW